jgi:hypothetical protein
VGELTFQKASAVPKEGEMEKMITLKGRKAGCHFTGNL